MTAKPLSGKELAAAIRADVTTRAARLTDASTPPRLTVVTATKDESSAWYVSSIAKAATKVGITCAVLDCGPDASADALRETLRSLSADPAVHGIIMQTPLPQGIRLDDVAGSIDIAKDIDGANPASLGHLAVGHPVFAPATAEAVIELLDHHGIPLSGAHVTVVGRSAVVGKPLAHLLLNRDATVTVCHSRTRDLSAVTERADALVAAVGRAGLITADHVGKEAVVIDVGTNVTQDGGLVGDVAPGAVERASALTPVPGGVGPVTTALLLRHTVQAAERQSA
ncbi:bifunctional 5,10-methylenetetrahydrofolate dehydrogenase/5,10-methenyltetrahydrofolate cyclohydrolase [Streptomyces sp. UNOC14_S4]|uniref:bifunctional 5,10-methylenetetrahydrofolate dehydrogenase/5,10-methenyltetrahydrofolate cyclohydrolase n=1 Tax=Streptomyces sp. UNOC14_S4 TaxID=2872340 RepID=UPI001E54D6F1|nr:bifunctional 5,10-methylenetetrahydrofolate dehydrogenase/5,10-methenyltetrahydrofolate cyclohydrolase [Streptomyces sp. UNOC14_S4]MCC3770902.1 bifunctional 5,10-methylenetetrahydrofolate dehydrogenase/5,10-methenyltetrahydrofolate cyclohydrolase [Streptomyces sp. UNOC14_S4]